MKLDFPFLFTLRQKSPWKLFRQHIAHRCEKTYLHKHIKKKEEKKFNNNSRAEENDMLMI